MSTSSTDSRGARRGHRVRDHTADAGIEAWAGTGEALLEEAALALADIASDVEPGAGPGRSETIRVEAADAEGLVFAWLNELVGLIDARAAAIGAVTVTRAELGPPSSLRAIVDLVPFDGRLVRRRSDVKSATYHLLSVRRDQDGWSLVAYLDI